MDTILEDMCDEAVRAAIQANRAAFLSILCRWPHAELYEDPELRWFITGIPNPLFNSVVWAHLAPERADERICETLDVFSRRRVPMQWTVGPDSAPSDLGERLERRGLVYTGDHAGMAADLRELRERSSAPEGLFIDEVDDVETFERWLEPVSVCFGLPGEVRRAVRDSFVELGFGDDVPWRHYIGWLDGKPAAASTLFLGAGVAGVYNVATLPDSQRQGIGAALAAAPLRDAQKLGYRVGTLITARGARRMYERMGFEERCLLSNYVWQGDTENSPHSDCRPE